MINVATFLTLLTERFPVSEDDEGHYLFLSPRQTLLVCVVVGNLETDIELNDENLEFTESRLVDYIEEIVTAIDIEQDLGDEYGDDGYEDKDDGDEEEDNDPPKRW